MLAGRHAAAKMLRKGKRKSREELEDRRRKSEIHIDSLGERNEHERPSTGRGSPFSAISENEELSAKDQEMSAEKHLSIHRKHLPRESILRRKLEEKYHLIKTIAAIKRHVPEYKDPKKYEGLTKSYLEFSNEIEKIVRGHTFRGFIIFVIVIAGFLVGLQTYDEWENNAILVVVENVILVVFAIECVVKMLAEGLRPYMYFWNHDYAWNTFDFFIVLLAAPFFQFGDADVAVLRLLRLSRVVKLLNKIPQLQMIVMGLIGGLKSIAYILGLLLLVFYLFAIMGMIFFKDNDPFHFGNLGLALLTLFRAATLEDWTDIYYINYYGCGNPMYQTFIYTTNKTEANGGGIRFCNTSKAITRTGSPIVTTVFFVIFIIISALVMLSLFIGAVTMSMSDSMEEMQRITREEEREVQLAKARARAKRRARDFASRTNLFSDLEGGGGGREGRAAGGKRAALIGKKKIKPKLMEAARAKVQGKEVTPTLPRGQSQVEKHPSAMEDMATFAWKAGKAAVESVERLGSFAIGTGPSAVSEMTEEEIIKQKRLKIILLSAWDAKNYKFTEITNASLSNIPSPFWREVKRFALAVKWVVDSEDFNTFITVTICVASLLVGLGTFVEEARSNVAKGLATSMGHWKTVEGVINICDLAILAIFIVEILLKTMAHYPYPHYFIYHRELQWWNIFDVIIVVGSFFKDDPKAASSDSGGTAVGEYLVVIRLLRLLRVLRLVKSLPELQVIVIALVEGLQSINYIGLILFLFFYIFAILGMIFFEKNDPFHFGTLDSSIMTLFRCATLEDWSDVMYINIYGCVSYGYGVHWPLPGINATNNHSEYDAWPREYYWPTENGCHIDKSTASPVLAVLYFVSFVLIGALVLMTLFIGVVTTSMDKASGEQEIRMAIDKRVNEVAKDARLPQNVVDMYKECFDMIDVDNSGTIDTEELDIALESINRKPTRDEMLELMTNIDDDNSGEIDFAEFLMFMARLKGLLSDEGEKGMKVQSIIYRSGRFARQRLIDARAQLEAEEAVQERAKLVAKTMKVSDSEGQGGDYFDNIGSEGPGSRKGSDLVNSDEVIPFAQGIGASLGKADTDPSAKDAESNAAPSAVLEEKEDLDDVDDDLGDTRTPLSSVTGVHVGAKAAGRKGSVISVRSLSRENSTVELV